MSDVAGEIEAMEDRRWAAQIGADLGALEELLDDELSYTHSNGIVDTKRSFIDAIKSEMFDYRSADRSEGAVVVIGDTAMKTGRVAMHVVANQGARSVDLDSRYSAIWVRREGTWRFLCWQSTTLPA